AICEQTEARGGGLLEREVVRVVTPGTILEEESLDPAAPSLLAALATDGARYGLAAIDFATGAFRATEVESWDAAREELERLAPPARLAPLPAARRSGDRPATRRRRGAGRRRGAARVGARRSGGHRRPRAACRPRRRAHRGAARPRASGGRARPRG